ncbi:MAG: RNA polymerase sigma factor [Planctomycetota bacterium]|jgi:RNA polymerase sigma-70 factor (ECF subfamily)|nr:RNA polymerase sigma factor [Planctomycetota bacterium]
MPEADPVDQRIVSQVLAGDNDAFSQLVERHSQRIHQQMRTFSRDPLVTEELVQDVFVEAFLHLGDWRGEAPFGHWLARIATFTGYRYWRRRERQKKEIPLEGEREELSAPPVEEETVRGNPEAAAILLHELLALLPASDRLLLSLVYQEELSTAEIALRLGLSRALVPMRVFKAKLKLKRLAAKKPWKERLQWMIS